MSPPLHGASLDKLISLTALWLSSQREKKRGRGRGRSYGKEGVGFSYRLTLDICIKMLTCRKNLHLSSGSDAFIFYNTFSITDCNYV